MTEKEYTSKTLQLLNSQLTEKEKLNMCVMGLSGEAGETIDIFKKHFYHKHPLDMAKVCNELGDVTFYLYAICGLLGLDMDQIRAGNIEKLGKRYPNLEFTPERSINRND